MANLVTRSAKENSSSSGLSSTLRGARVVIATRHGKANAVRPAFDRFLQAKIQTVRADTDSLGTFTGEIPRRLSPLASAVEKCRMAHQATGARYCLGSEGSFGPHPHMPFLPANHEILAFTDFVFGYTVFEQVLVFETNFAAATVTSLEELRQFAQKAKFPSHALVLRSTAAEPQITIVKGIVSWESLKAHFTRIQKKSATGQVAVETDMRAHKNPTRMHAIAQ
ncbi:MAG: hypothetical protein N2Z22_10345, partial [Turneriella sp.]|nr:hypothetical protein [Turneriella sp.]